MPYRVFGRDSKSGQLAEMFFRDAATEDAAREQAAAYGITVETIVEEKIEREYNPYSDPDLVAMACPLCGDKMVRGHIWVEGHKRSGSLVWQAGRQVQMGFFPEKNEELLSERGSYAAESSAKQAFRCVSCGALLTDFKDPDPDAN